MGVEAGNGLWVKGRVEWRCDTPVVVSHLLTLHQAAHPPVNVIGNRSSAAHPEVLLPFRCRTQK
jgi:hypothetical protein